MCTSPNHAHTPELVYFAEVLLPLAVQMENTSRGQEAQGQALGACMYHQLYVQLWDLLPGFCTLPVDGPVVTLLCFLFLSCNLIVSMY